MHTCTIAEGGASEDCCSYQFHGSCHSEESEGEKTSAVRCSHVRCVGFGETAE